MNIYKIEQDFDNYKFFVFKKDDLFRIFIQYFIRHFFY